MNIYCPKCGGRLKRDQIVIASATATCRDCGVTLSLTEMLAREDARWRYSQRPVSADRIPPKPDRISVQECDQSICFTLRWYEGVYWFVLIFCIAWNGITAHILMEAYVRGTLGFSILATCGHSLAGVFLAWLAICGLLNRTRIELRGGRLTVCTRPLPPRRALQIDATDVIQFYCRKSEGMVASVVSGFELVAVRADGLPLHVFSHFAKLEELRYIERVLEQRLGIQDRRVEGEYRDVRLRT